jgi:hypothetical protein
MPRRGSAGVNKASTFGEALSTQYSIAPLSPTRQLSFSDTRIKITYKSFSTFRLAGEDS